MRKNAPAGRRSACPLNASVETLGDRWSLLVIRDMMVRGARTFKELLASREHIATNILANRLRRLEADGVLEAKAHPLDRRRHVYRLTRKGIGLAPVLMEMVLWAAAHEKTGNQALVRAIRKGKRKFLAGIHRRWLQAQTRPERAAR
ncbi:MAG TPA: helix-turn-helix domain-containing protein [Candidatus Acidoferrum sp.]|nr:helix-turn-helix domain-containing protein [Candidatus Acidoferrum sp.]